MDDLPPPVPINNNFPVTSKPFNFPRKPGFWKKAFNFIIKIKWVKVTMYFAGFSAFLAIVVSHPVFKNAFNHYFPNTSPLFGRDVSFQGVLKSSSSGLYTLVLPDSSSYILRFKPSAALANLKRVNEVVVKGNLTWEPYVIENAEIYPLNFTVSNDDSDSFKLQTSLAARSPAEAGSDPAVPSDSFLPALYSGLKWETNQTKTLIFTSGKRKIEQEGIYMESAKLNVFPQEFINYYLENLKGQGFKETLNSISPEGIIITYAKDNLFLTFGVRNIYKGSGDSKKLISYQAYLEHN